VLDELRRAMTRVTRKLATKGGKVIALVTYEVSADHTTLTSRSSGVIEQVLVFERRQRAPGPVRAGARSSG
jgi:hypothetical protein